MKGADEGQMESSENDTEMTVVCSAAAPETKINAERNQHVILWRAHPVPLSLIGLLPAPPLQHNQLRVSQRVASLDDLELSSAIVIYFFFLKQSKSSYFTAAYSKRQSQANEKPIGRNETAAESLHKVIICDTGA